MTIFRKEKGLPEPEEKKVENEPAAQKPTVENVAEQTETEMTENAAEQIEAEMTENAAEQTDTVVTETEQCAVEETKQETVSEPTNEKESVAAPEQTFTEEPQRQNNSKDDHDDRPRGLFSKGTIE
jgi:hypothetical protein